MTARDLLARTERERSFAVAPTTANRQDQGKWPVEVEGGRIPEDALDERVIIGTWETRADWEAWHNTDEFKQTRAQLEQPDADTRREWWHEVVVEQHR